MTDPVDNTITASSTYCSVNSINNIQDSAEIAYNSAYKTYEDDSETPGTESDNRITTPSNVTGENHSDRDSCGHAAYDPEIGAYDEHYDYRVDGTMRHDWERRLPDGTHQLWEVDKFDDGRAHVHLVYRNPNTGMEAIHDYEK